MPLEGGDEKLYMGLVGTNSVDDEDIIAFLSTSRESFIEYDITRMVYNLSNPELPVIGLLSSLPINGMGPHAALQRRHRTTLDRYGAGGEAFRGADHRA